ARGPTPWAQRPRTPGRRRCPATRRVTPCSPGGISASRRPWATPNWGRGRGTASARWASGSLFSRSQTTAFREGRPYGKKAPALAALRGQGALAKPAGAERQAWRQLWADEQALLRRVQRQE